MGLFNPSAFFILHFHFPLFRHYAQSHFSGATRRHLGKGAIHSATTMSSSTFKVALIQMLVSEDKAANITKARRLLHEASSKGAAMAVLPEMWNTPYDTSKFRGYGEVLPEIGYKDVRENNVEKIGESVRMLIDVGKETGMVVVGGSVAEVENFGGDGGRVWNTCIVVDERGEVVGKHRKVHLFDVDVPGGIKFRESDTLSAGECLKAVDLRKSGEVGCKVGVMICYDVRFVETALVLAQEECELLVVPGAFNMTTGPLHWELLARSRAVDTQCWVAMCSPARDKSAGYVAYGHSMVVDPWGKIAGELDEKEGVLLVDVDLKVGKVVRQALPTSKQRRSDIYQLEQKQKDKVLLKSV